MVKRYILACVFIICNFKVMLLLQLLHKFIGQQTDFCQTIISLLKPECVSVLWKVHKFNSPTSYQQIVPICWSSKHCKKHIFFSKCHPMPLTRTETASVIISVCHLVINFIWGFSFHKTHTPKSSANSLFKYWIKQQTKTALCNNLFLANQSN